jgi:hypothetical protein
MTTATLETGPHAADGKLRHTILITHANPEDNLFSRWLAARLTSAGYAVWVDLRSLAIGEDFWDSIETELRDRAIKQIVVVSDSVRKPGVKKELALGDFVGKQLKDPDFMIPVRVSSIAHGEFPPELLRRNSIDAFPNWAAALGPILDTLQKAGVRKAGTFEGTFVQNMIAAQEARRLVVQLRPETLFSNWFPLTEVPMLRLFGAKGTRGQLEAWLQTHDIPHIQHSGLVGTFCDPATFAMAGDSPPTLDARFWIPFNDLVRGIDVAPFVDRADSRRHAVQLLRQHWDCAMKRRGLVGFEFAAGRVGWFFPDGLVQGPATRDLPDRKVSRVLSGKFKERRWHFCLVAFPKLWPEPLFRVHANIALSTDGRTALPGEQTHRVRRRLTRSWWNDKWRDMLLASMGWLADAQPTLNLAGGAEPFQIASMPEIASFPISYGAEELRAVEEDAAGEIELDDELNDTDEEDITEPFEDDET